MKKRYIITITIFLLIIVAIIGVIIVKNINKNDKDYEIEQIKNYNYFLLKQGEKYGVLDRQGKIVINSKYEEVKIPNPEKDVFICYENNTPIVLNNKGEKIFVEYNKIEPIRLKNVVSELMYEKTVLIYQKNEKYGLIDFNAKKITEPIYESIETLPYKEGEFLVKQQNKVGVINVKGYKIIDINYDQITIDNYYQDNSGYKFSGYIVSNTTKEGYRYGYVNAEGKEIIKPEYNEIQRVNEIQDKDNTYIILAKNGQYGVWKNQEEIIKNEYQSIRYSETNKVFILEKSKKYGASNTQGDIVIQIEYDQIDVTGKYLYAKKGEEIQVYDNMGKKADINSDIAILDTINEKYKIKLDTSNGISYGVIDDKGEQIIPEKYNYIEYLFNNYFIASNKEGKLGVLDDKGNIKLELKYNSVQKIQNTNLIQALDNKTKSIEIYSGQIEKICEMKNSTIEEKENYISLYNQEEILYIDKKSEKEIPNTEVFKENKIFAKQEEGKWGFVEINGNMKVEYKYDKVTEFNQYGFAGIKENGKWGVINSSGEIILKPTYEIKNEKNLSFIGEYYSVEYGFGEIYYTK